MANSHFWRRSGRRDWEREQFATVMRKVEKIRVREGLTKRALAAEIGTSEDALRNWAKGIAVSRTATVAKIKAFLTRGKIASDSHVFRR